MSKRVSIILLGLAVAAFAPACSKDEKKKEAPAAEPAGDEAPVADPPVATNDDLEAHTAAVSAVLEPYEECRSLLAADKGDGVAACAKAMADAATAGADKVIAEAKPHMTAVASAAAKLGETAADDLDALRLAYGGVSEPVVALLTATPKLARDYHVFECPMAKGYKRWAQRQAAMANPYMGTAMLECGTEVHDHHKGMMKGGDHMMKDGDHMMKGGDHMDHDG